MESAPSGAPISTGFRDPADFYEERLHGFAQNQQSMVNLTGAQGISIIMSGERFSCFEGRTEGFEQTLDTQTGIYARRLEWTSPRGRKTVLAFQGLASFDLPQLAVINIEITPINWSGDIRIVSSLNADVTQGFDPNGPRKAHHVKKLLDTVFLSARGGTLAAQIKARGSGLTAACAVPHSWEGGFVQEETRAGSECAESVLAAQAVRGEPLRLSKYCVYKDSRRFQEPLSAVTELLEGAVLRPFPSWASRQEEFLGRFREETRCGIEGNDLLDTSLDYSAFCLLSSAGMDGVGNVSSKGLSGESYEGHYFWDTEIYVFPFFLLPRAAGGPEASGKTCPDAGRSAAAHARNGASPRRAVHLADDCRRGMLLLFPVRFRAVPSQWGHCPRLPGLLGRDRGSRVHGENRPSRPAGNGAAVDGRRPLERGCFPD